MVGTQIRTYTFWFYPLALSFTPGAPEEVSSRLVQAIRDPGMALFMGGPKQNPRLGLPIHTPKTASLQTPWTTWPGPHSQTRPLHWPRTQPQGLLWTPHSNHPGKESPGSICTWCLPLLGGHCHVPLVLSSPTADIITTSSQAAHSQSQ